MITVKGLGPEERGLTKGFANIKNLIKASVTKSLLENATDVVKDTKKLTPVDTGRLISSYKVKTDTIGNAKIKAKVYNETWYAGYVHDNMNANFKRVGAEAQFLLKGGVRNKKQLLNTVADNLEKALKK